MFKVDRSGLECPFYTPMFEKLRNESYRDFQLIKSARIERRNFAELWNKVHLQWHMEGSISEGSRLDFKRSESEFTALQSKVVLLTATQKQKYKLEWESSLCTYAEQLLRLERYIEQKSVLKKVNLRMSLDLLSLLQMKINFPKLQTTSIPTEGLIISYGFMQIDWSFLQKSWIQLRQSFIDTGKTCLSVEASNKTFVSIQKLKKSFCNFFKELNRSSLINNKDFKVLQNGIHEYIEDSQELFDHVGKSRNSTAIEEQENTLGLSFTLTPLIEQVHGPLVAMSYWPCNLVHLEACDLRKKIIDDMKAPFFNFKIHMPAYEKLKHLCQIKSQNLERALISPVNGVLGKRIRNKIAFLRQEVAEIGQLIE